MVGVSGTLGSGVDPSEAADDRAGLSSVGPSQTDDPEREDPIDRSPGRVSVALATGFAALAAVLLPSSLSAILGVPGAALVAAGSVRGSRRTVGYGLATFAVAISFAGVSGAPPLALVLSTLLAVLAWDAGRYGILVGEQLGREAATTRIQVAHTALNATVAVAGAGLASATALIVSGGQPVAAVALLLFGAVVLFAALGPSR